MKMKIAIGGKKGSGKDTVSDWLCQECRNIKKISFLDPIYEILNFSQDTCNLPRNKDNQFLEFIEDWGRKQNTNLWLDLTLKKANSIDEDVVISDIRYKNELDKLNDDGWITIKIVRTSIDENRVGTENDLYNREIDSIPDNSWIHIIQNDSTIDDLYEKIDSIVSDFSQYESAMERNESAMERKYSDISCNSYNTLETCFDCSTFTRCIANHYCGCRDQPEYYGYYPEDDPYETAKQENTDQSEQVLSLDKSNFFFDLIQANSDKEWDWFYISANPNITWEIIQANPYKPWDWSGISSNLNIHGKL